MRVIVLGSAAGGGYPQWNCRCSVCRRGWEQGHRLTQSSVAVSAAGEDWVLLNCSPDIREQIGRTPALRPRGGVRSSPISAILLTNGDIDHIGGLLTLRERTPLSIYCTAETRESIGRNPIFSALASGIVRWPRFRLETPFKLNGLAFQAFPVAGKIPLYMEGAAAPGERIGEATVGVSVTDAGGRRLVYVPGCANVDEKLRTRIRGADLLLFDGTVYHDDELIREGVGHKSGRRMGHQPIAGSDGTIEALRPVEAGRRLFVHINNTNPILLRGTPERAAVEAAGWEVAEDGMEISL